MSVVSNNNEIITNKNIMISINIINMRYKLNFLTINFLTINNINLL